MYKSIIHCLNGITDRDKISNNAIENGLTINIKNIHAIDLINDDQTIHDNFLAQYNDDSTIVIFYHNDHPLYNNVIFKNHSKISTGSRNINPLVPSPTIAQSWAAHYNFPPYDPVPATAPTIGIISLGGWYQQSDLTHYWAVIQTQPVTSTVTPILISPNIQPIFGASPNADLENTLDIEIVGGICYK